MHIPNDISLEAWIRELIANDKLYQFYKSDEWMDLAASVMEEQHHECEWCREQGVYSSAVTVHHVNEVKVRPELALSRTYVTYDGITKANLIALCFLCHNKAHKRFGFAPKKPPITPERW